MESKGNGRYFCGAVVKVAGFPGLFGSHGLGTKPAGVRVFRMRSPSTFLLGLPGGLLSLISAFRR